MTFGVPVQHFPVSYEGQLKTTAHLKWLARRKMKEVSLENIGTFNGIDIPGTKDVLFGRGKRIQDHYGNKMMRTLIEDFMPEYRRNPKNEKSRVTWKVVVSIKGMGGRFLKQEQNGWWFEVSDETAHGKISMTYRTSRGSMASSSPGTIKEESSHDHEETSGMYHQQFFERDPKRARVPVYHTKEQGVVDYSADTSSPFSSWRICSSTFLP